MVSTYVADGVDGHQPRVEYLRAHAQLVSNLFPHGHGRAFVEGHYHPKVHDVHQHPIGWQVMMVPVLVVEVFGEGFASSRPSVGFAALIHEVLVAFLAHSGEVCAVEEAECSRLLGQQVRELRAHVDFHAFDGVKHH